MGQTLCLKLKYDFAMLTNFQLLIGALFFIGPIMLLIHFGEKVQRQQIAEEAKCAEAKKSNRVQDSKFPDIIAPEDLPERTEQDEIEAMVAKEFGVDNLGNLKVKGFV